MRLFSEYIHKLERTLMGSRPLADVACNFVELCPGTEVHHPPAFFNKDDLDRITGVDTRSSLKQELWRISEHTRVSSPTIAYTVKDVLLVNGALFKKRFKYGIAVMRPPLINSEPTVSLEDGGVLGQTWLGSKFFGHWLNDDVPLYWAASDLGEAVGVNRAITPQQSGYTDIFGLKYRLLPTAARIREIKILEDHGFNAYKAQRWEKMRETLRQKSTSSHPGAMLIRGQSGASRVLENELEIADRLAGIGFRVVDPGSATLEEVLQATVGAKIIVGVEGSHLSHGLMGVSQGGGMIILQPPFRFNNIYKDRCDVLGLKYGFLIGNTTEKGFNVDPNHIFDMIEKMSRY